MAIYHAYSYVSVGGSWGIRTKHLFIIRRQQTIIRIVQRCKGMHNALNIKNKMMKYKCFVILLRLARGFADIFISDIGN